MRSFVVALAAAGALLAPARLAAQRRWQVIGTTSVGNPVSIDPKSVTKADGIVTALVRAEFVKPVATPKGAITSSRTVAMFDCARQVVAVKENTYYHDERANRVYQRSVVGVPGFGPAIRGTLPDIALAHFCGK
jgi:hypothetical protein